MPIVGTEPGDATTSAAHATEDAIADFSAFYRAEHAAVVGTIYALTGDWARAEELAQDVFVSAHRHWERVLAHPRPDLWVRRAAVNRSTSWFRRRRVEQRALAREHGAAPQIADPPPDDLAWLLDHVRRLPRQQAHAVVLVHVEQLTKAEAAHVLGCSESTLRTHLQRGRAALRARIEEEGPDA